VISASGYDHRGVIYSQLLHMHILSIILLTVQYFNTYSNDLVCGSGGRQIGGFSTWEACHASVNCYKGACYKGYKTKEEAFAAFSVMGTRSVLVELVVSQ
jgi:hypothetical protein